MISENDLGKGGVKGSSEAWSDFTPDDGPYIRLPIVPASQAYLNEERVDALSRVPNGVWRPPPGKPGTWLVSITGFVTQSKMRELESRLYVQSGHAPFRRFRS